MRVFSEKGRPVLGVAVNELDKELATLVAARRNGLQELPFQCIEATDAIQVTMSVCRAHEAAGCIHPLKSLLEYTLSVFQLLCFMRIFADEYKRENEHNYRRHHQHMPGKLRSVMRIPNRNVLYTIQHEADSRTCRTTCLRWKLPAVALWRSPRVVMR